MCQVRCIVGNNSILDRGAFFLLYTCLSRIKDIGTVTGKGGGEGFAYR